MSETRKVRRVTNEELAAAHRAELKKLRAAAKYKPELTEQQIDMIDDALRSYFDAHFDPQTDDQPTADLLEMICDARYELSCVLPCSEEGCKNKRMGHHSDLCSEHYAQLTRGELKVRVA